MIYIEVVKHSDPEALGLYEFEFDQITIGRSKKNDLIFLTKEIPLFFLSIKFIHHQLVAQSFNRTSFFYVNSKKISGTLKINLNDIISFGSTQLKIIRFKQSLEQTDFSMAFDDFNKKAPELKFSLEFIEQVLIHLEKDQNV
ncbi:MAG: FHA domain-containing protein [Bacteriovorax sp.]|nr:FHA domain-containing protein [Bacteriovorax sp.]